MRRRGRRHPRLRWLARQFGAAIVTLVVITVVTFGATNVRSPRDVALNALGREAVPEQIDAFIEAHELDAPVHVRYMAWLGRFVRGDWGVSVVTDRPVREDIQPRIVNTLVLSLAALLIALPLSLAVGVYMARRTRTLTDLSLSIVVVAVAAMPEFVVAIGALVVFAVTLGWLPVDSTALSFGTLPEKVEAYALPVFTLVVSMAPYLIRMARASMREALTAPYVQAAVLRGLSRRMVIWGHAMPNAAVPLVNAVAINVVYLLSGVIVVENVFAFPGIGQLLVEAVGTGDAVAVQAIALLMGAMFIAVSLAADLLVAYFNPKLRSNA